MRTKANRLPRRRLVGAVPAFTILEVMVVAVLSMLTVVAALSAWQVMERQFYAYRQETSEAIELRQLQVLLENDFLKSDLVTKQDSALVFRYPGYEVAYQLEEQQIARKLLIEGSRDDVFPVPVASWGASFRGEAVDFGIADGARITTALLGKPATLAFSKTYSAKEILQLDDHAN